MIERTCEIRVGYRDTDQMGVVHHAVYLEFFERGRTELLRQLGMPYAALELAGIALPVLEYGARMIRPAKYDDVVTVSSGLAPPTGPRLRIEYRITRGNETLVEGYTIHAFTKTPSLRPIRPPSAFLALVEHFEAIGSLPADA